MEITVKESTMVSPTEDTPKTSLWLPNMDLVMTAYHISTVYFYKPNGSSNFFDAKLLKEALSKILVPFYPVAGRIGYDEKGRLEIVCNEKGVLFTEAETTSVMDDFVQDFTDGSKVPQLVPKIDYSGGISSYPLLALQVTTFKCGGISLGVSVQHNLANGPAALHFINSWAEMARGLSPSIAPILDHSLLRARDPPTPIFRHVKALKQKANENSKDTKYSTYTILTAHIWHCATKARDLSKDQELKLTIPIDGRNRLSPPLPPGYFGNVIFFAVLFALAGDLQSEPFTDTLKRIQEILKEMNDEYLKSGVDYIEKTPDIKTITRGPQTMRCRTLVSIAGCGCPSAMQILDGVVLSL
ncbi:hypothetical protein DITRI_Ditri10aG0064600 [Diplodiscus trichospermus]